MRAIRLDPRAGDALPRAVTVTAINLDGSLKSVPPWQGFDDLDKSRHGLVPLEQEIWRGFIFVRMEAGLPSVAEMMAPYDDEIAPHDFESLVPQGRVTLRPRAVNWKNVADNYGDVERGAWSGKREALPRSANSRSLSVCHPAGAKRVRVPSGQSASTALRPVTRTGE